MKALSAVLCLSLFLTLSGESAASSSEEKLYEEVIAIKVMIRDIQKKLDQLEQKKESQPDRSSSGFIGRKADPEILGKIELPDNPTRDQIVKYVNEIAAASSGQNSFSPNDPQIDMFLKIGPENFATLLEHSRHSSSMPSYHIREALNRMAREEHKDVVLEALPQNTFLIEAVIKNMWLDDAKQTLIDGLSSSTDSLPSEWIRAVAGFQDPETYEALKRHLVFGSNKKTTYEAIKYLPGIELEDAVGQAWQNAKFQSKCASSSMVPIAVEFGHLDALERALEDLDVTKGCRVHNAMWLVIRFTDARGNSDEVRSWFAENKDKLEFDPKTKKYRVKD